MKKGNQKSLFAAVSILVLSGVWTVAVKMVDVKPIGPQGSMVGFAALNQFVHGLTGVHMNIYHLTDWLSIVPLGFVLGFALLGLMQWMKRKRLGNVDRSLLILGGFYLAVMAVYVFFEVAVVNYRPVLIEGKLETSYPSSTTMLVLCVMPTAVIQLNERIKNHMLRRLVTVTLIIYAILMTVGRIVSGVHWITDIIGGVLFSTGLVMMYHAFSYLKCRKA